MRKLNNLFAWASNGENGPKNNKPGNQTGKELKVGNLYNFGQNICIRFVDVKYGRIAGKIAKTLAKHPSIGYDQTGRYTLYSLSENYKWDVDKVLEQLETKFVECDCSSFIATVINLTFSKKIVNCFTTSSMERECSKLKEKFTILPYSKAKESFKKGDILVRRGKHTIINV